MQNWERIGDKFYRRIQLYTNPFDPDLELENYTVAGAPFSGAVGKRFLLLLANTTDMDQLCVAMKAKFTPIEATAPPSPPSTSTVAPASS